MDQCIVCLDELESVVHGDLQDANGGVASIPSPVTTTNPSKNDDHQAIALIKPCNHVLHDECLREWSQKANSCPICRQQFNLVHVLDKVGGNFLSEYEVEDKKQVAEFDPSAWIEDEEDEEEEARPCPVCGESDQPDVLLLCDSCDAPYHTHCIGLHSVPSGNWFCMECTHDGAYERAAALHPQSPSRRSAIPLAPRTQASVRRNRQRLRTDHWYGAWSLFSSRIHDVAGLDLDFSDDDYDQSMTDYRDLQRRAEQDLRRHRQWQRRFDIAGAQGAGAIFRASAPTRLRDPTPQPPVETVEETRAWGAFERAKKMETSSPRNNKRKSRSVTGSPTENQEPQEPERKLKRPRTRRVIDNAEAPTAPASMASSSRTLNGHARVGSPTSRILNGTNGEPSFLSNLLKEVEMASTSDDDRSAFSATTVSGPNRANSPSLDYSSPAASPTSSASYHTPRALSLTPPPNRGKRSSSPLSLTSRVEPIFPPADYSPNRSPPENRLEHNRPDMTNSTLRQPRPRRRQPTVLPRSEEASPVRASMSIEAKEGINKIVKNALAPHWRSAEITKEQYSDINRDVSRKLYEIVADRNIDDERQKLTWEKIATAEVATAVKSLTA